MQVRTEVLMAVTVKIIAVIWDVMSCTPPDYHQCFGALAASISMVPIFFNNSVQWTASHARRQ
jgi:hypothetical protein